jgi:hypothetical protein
MCQKFNGGLGAAVALESRLHLWAREHDAPWVQTKVIDLANLIPVGPMDTPATSPKVMGYAHGTNTIFVSTVAGLFTIDIQSEQARQVSEDRDFYPLIPIVGFFIPNWTPKGEHHDLPMPNAGEGGGQEERTLEQAQALFDKGSKAMKERDFIHASDCLGHALNGGPLRDAQRTSHGLVGGGGHGGREARRARAARWRHRAPGLGRCADVRR